MEITKLNLVELNKQEIEEIDGGMIPALLALAGAAFYFGWELGREYARKH